VTTYGERHIYAFDLPPEDLWRAVADGDTFDRDARLPEARYRFETRAGVPPLAVAEARVGPAAFEWQEPPLEWEAPLRLAVARRFRRGPFERYAAEMRFFSDGAGSRIEHDVELETRGAIGALLARPLLAYARIGAERAYRRAENRARSGPSNGSRSGPDVAAGSIAGVARFVDAFEALRTHTEEEPAIAARLAALVEHAPANSRRRLRPYELADAWGFPRERVVAAMLAAARAGLLGASWTIVCPRCRMARQAVPTLHALGSPVDCEVCGITFSGDFDRNVELTFDLPLPLSAPHADEPRPLRPQPARQILAQRTLAAGSMAVFSVMLQAGAYVVQVLPDRVARFTVEEDAGAATLDARIEHAAVRAGASVVRAGNVRLRFTNQTEHDAVVRIVEAELSRGMATAAAVTALQAFRDLFPDDAPSEDAPGAIRSLTIVCAEVVGLEGIAAEFGDAHTAQLVATAFDALRELVALGCGAIVRTAGDGLMAVFTYPREAVETALRFGELVAPLELRIAVHRGPCVAICANGRLDYFGATVSHVSRLARTARAGEVLLTNALAEDDRIARLLPPGERGIVTLRGLVEPVDVLRVRPAVSAAAR
jgi:class 3 adenylate cyclase